MWIVDGGKYAMICRRFHRQPFCYNGGPLVPESVVSEYQIYHNPRCSKSRATLALLQEHGIEPEIVLYLEHPPAQAALKRLLEKLDISAAELVRRGEAEYKALGLGAGSSQADLLRAMSAHPKLIERPIVVRGERAVLGRPPENVLALLA